MRSLVVVADDYGIGPATSRGILRLCHAETVTGTVLLVNSPYAEVAVTEWRRSPPDADLGWHPCLTLDAPVMPAREVPSLVDGDGRFRPLGRFLARLAAGRINPADVWAEFDAQLDRFRELTGHWPGVVNAHHHVQVFPTVGAALRGVLSARGLRPFLRKVREPRRTLIGVPGARSKRLFLSWFGRRESRRQAADGFAGGDWLAGITNPDRVHDEGFFQRWLAAMPGRVVELTCHPGEHDVTLLGRDAKPGDGNLERRVREYDLLSDPAFRRSFEAAGFQLARPSQACAGLPPLGRLRKTA